MTNPRPRKGVRLAGGIGVILAICCSAYSQGTGGASEVKPPTPSSDPKAKPASGSRPPNVNETVARYIAAWNETDGAKRRGLVAQTWAEKGQYVDAHRRGTGPDEIDSMIAAAQQHFPGYRLRLVSGIESHNGYVRFSWAAGGAPEAPLYLGGTDFGTIGEDGRFLSVAGFVDAAPAPVKQGHVRYARSIARAEVVKGAYEGKPTNSTGKATMVYVKEGNSWRGVHYHESRDGGH